MQKKEWKEWKFPDWFRWLFISPFGVVALGVFLSTFFLSLIYRPWRAPAMIKELIEQYRDNDVCPWE